MTSSTGSSSFVSRTGNSLWLRDPTSISTAIIACCKSAWPSATSTQSPPSTSTTRKKQSEKCIERVETERYVLGSSFSSVSTVAVSISAYRRRSRIAHATRHCSLGHHRTNLRLLPSSAYYWSVYLCRCQGTPSRLCSMCGLPRGCKCSAEQIPGRTTAAALSSMLHQLHRSVRYYFPNFGEITP